MDFVLRRRVKLYSLLLSVCVFGNKAFAGNFSDSSSSALTDKDVVVLQLSDPAPTAVQKINTLELNTANSSSFEVMKTMKEMAIKAHANIVKIAEEYDDKVTHAPDKMKVVLYSATNAHPYERAIAWDKTRKLDWTDFRGPIPADAGDMTAAATYCGIGFETNVVTNNAKPKIFVYNTFYPTQSWVRSDEKNESVLIHEQGHFDLCELYTRKLRQKLETVSLNVHNMKSALQRVYDEVNNEYEHRQDAYEAETEHGVNDAQEQKWTLAISKELAATEKWAE